MKVEDVRKIEEEITVKIQDVHKVWVDEFNYTPDHKMSCFDVVTLLEKKGLLSD